MNANLNEMRDATSEELCDVEGGKVLSVGELIKAILRDRDGFSPNEQEEWVQSLPPSMTRA